MLELFLINCQLLPFFVYFWRLLYCMWHTKRVVTVVFFECGIKSFVWRWYNSPSPPTREIMCIVLQSSLLMPANKEPSLFHCPLVNTNTTTTTTT